MGRRESEFKDELIRLYKKASKRNYLGLLSGLDIEELYDLYVNEYISEEQHEHLSRDEIIKKMMTQMTAVYKLDPNDVGRNAELIVLISNVKYDGEKMYVTFKKISPLKMRRFEEEMSVETLAKETGYSVDTVVRCESPVCDMRKQPQSLLDRFTKALDCELDDICW